MNQTGDDAAILFRISQLILVIILLNLSRDMGWCNQPPMTLEKWAVSTDGLPSLMGLMGLMGLGKNYNQGPKPSRSDLLYWLRLVDPRLIAGDYPPSGHESMTWDSLLVNFCEIGEIPVSKQGSLQPGGSLNLTFTQSTFCSTIYPFSEYPWHSYSG